MNKFALVLIFSFIAFIKGLTVDDFNTEPYYSFDWLDKDEQSFKVKYIFDQTTDTMPTFCYLYNSSVACKPEKCKIDDKTIECTVKGDKCKADGDNPSFKYYYTTRCLTTATANKINSTTSLTINDESTQEELSTFISDTGLVPGSDVSVTVAVCNGSFLKYSMLLLSLLIL